MEHFKRNFENHSTLTEECTEYFIPSHFVEPSVVLMRHIWIGMKEAEAGMLNEIMYFIYFLWHMQNILTVSMQKHHPGAGTC